ncbi:MAG TPA: thiolase family protein [Alphaproteobacteria bacterium]
MTTDWSQVARHAIVVRYDDAWVMGGARTPFADYCGVLAQVNPIDLGIKAAKAALERAGVEPAAVRATFAATVSPGGFDYLFLPRHIALYAGVPRERPALQATRVCCTGFELVAQAAQSISTKAIDVALCVGTESMSRHPLAAYTHRTGFKLGQVEFGDMLWEGSQDPSNGTNMGLTAENLARLYQITRTEADAYAALSFARAVEAQKRGALAEEIVPLASETFELEDHEPRRIALPRSVPELREDTHIRPTTVEQLARIKPAFGGVQTGGNSSAIVDGAAGVVVAGGDAARSGETLGRVVASAVVGVPPEIMGIGPVPAVRALLDAFDLSLDDIDRFEINEAFAAQTLACVRALDLDVERLNVNGGAIAFGHPLAATGVRATLSALLELRRRGLKRAIVTACAGGGQGMALLLEAA